MNKIYAITTDYIEKKMREILYNNNDFRDLTFNVPTKGERDFIKYETLKELLEDGRRTGEKDNSVF